MASFDVASAITEFVADASCESLELPHLSTGQRKNAKLLIAQHPELQCDSFGFGTDRRLHLFKNGRQPEALQQGMPAMTSGNAQEVSKQDLPPMDGFPYSPLPVRNTFIHIEDAPADERAVQSMPHGMFRQWMLVEASCKASCKVADGKAMDAFETEVDRAPTPASEPEAEPTAQVETTERQRCMPFGLGALVVVEGLTKLPAFNGLSAVVQGWDQASGRYSIMLVTGTGACHQAKIKEENLRLLLPCP